MSERGQREDVRIAHTVAYLLRCHGAMGGNVDDNNDDGDSVTGDKVDNDCDVTTDDDINDDDEGTTGDDDDDDHDNGNGATGDEDNSNGATGDKVNDDDCGSVTGDDNDVTMVTARWDTMTTTMAMDVVNDDNKCNDAILTMCDKGDNRNSDNGEDACPSTETTPSHQLRRRHSQA